MGLIIHFEPGEWGLVIILIIVLIMLGGLRFAKGLGEIIRNFKSGIPREQRQQSSDSRLSMFIVLILFAAVIILSVLRMDVTSDEQKLALSVVLLGWIAVGYWSFGRNLRKRDGR